MVKEVLLNSFKGFFFGGGALSNKNIDFWHIKKSVEKEITLMDDY